MNKTALFTSLMVVIVLWIFCVTVLFMPIGTTITGCIQKLIHQKKMYNMAKKKAKETGKKLIVIGNPSAPTTVNGEILVTYGCGDICIDIEGCNCKNSMKEDVFVALKKFPDNSAVIYESEVLEFIPRDIGPIVKEIERVSGGDMFATHVSGIRYKSLGDKWRLQHVIAQYPPHKPYKWVDTYGSDCSWTEGIY